MAPAAAYRSIRSGRMPSEEKKIVLSVSGAVEAAAAGAARASTGAINMETISTDENKRSRNAYLCVLLRLVWDRLFMLSPVRSHNCKILMGQGRCELPSMSHPVIFTFCHHLSPWAN